VIACASCGEENPERARFCLACGQPLVVEAPAGEERKVVSVLFVDLVGFTNRSDRADPEDVRATLRPYHERVKADIERFGGTVEKFIGDAVMAVFGAPVAHEDDAERAVRSGLRVLETIEDLRGEGVDLAVRAAVATGEAVVALDARPERGEGIVAGDVVNTAARLQASAAVGTVIVDEVTVRSSQEAIVFEPLDPVEAKGKAEPIAVWRAARARSLVGQPEAATHTPFVGREHERTLLLETFLRAERESSVQLVTVVGEPGIGKSRLVTELRVALDDRPDLITWRHGRCLPYGEGITFWALGEVIKAEAGIFESDDQAEAEGKLEQCVSALVEDVSEREWFASRLAPLAGVNAEGGAISREEAFTAWRRFLEALAARRPLVFVVEDLHWADEALLDFLEQLLDWAAPVPLLVLSTARPELYDRRPGWSGGRRNATTIPLSPLSGDETARLLQRLLERALLPAQTQASLLERAGGNPLYAEQFARMLTERGGGTDLQVPETVQALIAARLDTLSPSLKSLLHDASVIGRTFWTGAVAALGGRERDDALAGLLELVRREFVRPARVSSIKGEDEFSIWHALVRDVAYQQIPRLPRAQKHVAAAAWIEKSAQQRVSDHAEILVHHYEQALELSRAAGDDRPELRDDLVRFLLLAGDRAMRLDIAAAEGAYRRALELSTHGAEHAAVLVKLAGALQEQGRLPDAEGAYEEALLALRGTGDDHAAAVAMIGLARALWRRGQTARARQLTREAIPILERQPGPELLLAYERAAGEDAMGGRPREGLSWAEKGIALADELGVENVVRHLQFRGLARIDLGDAEGLSDMRDALELSLRLGLGIETATSYSNLGESVTAFEGVVPGLELIEASLDFARRCGLKHHEIWIGTSRLWYLYELGKWDELLLEADEFVRWDREQGGSSQIEIWALIASAAVHTHRGGVDAARRDAATFLPRAREVADPQTLVPALVQAAFASAVGGDIEEAMTLAAEFGRTSRGRTANEVAGLPTMLRICVAARELSFAQSLVDGAADAADTALARHLTITGRGILAEAHGQTEEAASLYAEAAAAWGAWGSVPERAYALLGLGRCGDEDAARVAVEIFERLGAKPALARAA